MSEPEPADQTATRPPGTRGAAPAGAVAPAGAATGSAAATASAAATGSAGAATGSAGGAEVAGGHPTAGLDDTVHQRHRLGILTITAEAQRADFGQLRAALGLTPGNLSRHLTVLEEAELVQVEKGYEGRRPRTWVRITSQGRKALAAELAALTELVRRHSAAS